MGGDLVADNAPAHVHLFHDCAAGWTGQDALEGPVFWDEARDLARLGQANEDVNVVIESNAASCGC